MSSLSSPTPVPASPSRRLARTVPVALAGVTVASLTFAAVLPLVANADGVIPVDAGSALVQTERELVLNRTTINGAVSAGGNLTYTGESRITGGPVQVPRAAGGARPVQLYVGGRPSWPQSFGQLLVNGSGGVAVADLGQTDVDDSGTDIVLTPEGSRVADRSITGTFDQSAGSVSAADLEVDTSQTFALYRSHSDELATCLQTVTVDDDGIVSLVPGITNVWNVTEEYMDQQLGTLNLSPAPSASTKLIVNITGAAGTLSLPWGMSSDISSHVIYNFVGTGDLRFVGAKEIRGTVYAPGFALETANRNVIEGNVIARSFQALPGSVGMRVENYPFTGPVECGRPVVAPTTAPAATTTVPVTTTAPATGSTPAPVTSTPVTGSTSATATQTTTSVTTGSGAVTTGPQATTASSATTGSTSSPSGSGAATTGATATTATVTAGSGSATTAAPVTFTASAPPAPPAPSTVPPSAESTTDGQGASATTTTAAAGSTTTSPPASGGQAPPSVPGAGPSSATTDSGTPTTASPLTGATATSGVSSTTPGSVTTSAGTPVSPGEVAIGAGTTTSAAPAPAGIPPVASATVSSGGSAALAAASSAGAAGPAGARIAFTGADVAGLILTGLGLLAAGVGMTWTTRRQNAAGRHIA